MSMLLSTQRTTCWAAPRRAAPQVGPQNLVELLLQVIHTLDAGVCLPQPGSDAAFACVGGAFTAPPSWPATSVAPAPAALSASPMRRWFATSGGRRTLTAWSRCSVGTRPTTMQPSFLMRPFSARGPGQSAAETKQSHGHGSGEGLVRGNEVIKKVAWFCTPQARLEWE